MKKAFSKFIRSQHAVSSLSYTVLALLSMLLMQYLTEITDRVFFVFIAVGASYTLVVFLLSIIIKHKYSVRISEDDTSLVRSDVPISLYNHIKTPIALCAENGTILWGNTAFRHLFESSGTQTRSIETLLGLTLTSLESEDDDGLLWENSDKKYRVSLRETSSGQYVVIWDDITEAENLRARMSDEETLFAIIVMDNIDEIGRIDQRFAASAAAKVNYILSEWSRKSEGTLKEYERNKYVFAFSAKHLTSFLEEQFPILDEIRNVGKLISAEEGGIASDIPVTVSIGIGAVGGTLSDKERASRSAIELALARGGDQAVLKNEAGVQYYGGITKTSQKRSTVRSRIIADKLISLVNDSSAVFIMGHRYADFDAFGACVGVARMVTHLGKPCFIIRDAANTNLTKCFKIFDSIDEYDPILVGEDEAKLIKNSENSLLIIVDVNNRVNFDYPELADSFARKVFIDHHRMAGEFRYDPLLQYIEPSSSSTCELVCEILDQAFPDIKLRKEEADIMLAGIMLDTKKFILNTGVRTFAAAQYLRGQGADPSSAQEYFKSDIDMMQREARFESKIQIYKKVIAISVTDEPCSADDRIPAAKAADTMLTIDGVLASFAVCRIVTSDRESIRISARSSGTINVQLIMERLGGGGHYDQAAVESSTVSLQKMLVNLRDAIDSYLAENPQVLK